METNPNKQVDLGRKSQYRHSITLGEQKGSHRKINFIRQISLKAEQDIDASEQHAQYMSDILQDAKFMRVESLNENEKGRNDTIISNIEPSIIIETGLTYHRDLKNNSQWFRWNLLFNIIVWLIVPLPFWLPFISNTVAFYVIPSIQAVFIFMWISKCLEFSSLENYSLFHVVIGLLALKNACILYRNNSRQFNNSYRELETRPIRHIVTISCYKEPVELISKSIQTIANQTEVNRIIMVIGFEEKTPDVNEKCQFLEEQFKNCGFERIIFTIHPAHIRNEIPGKCSNSNYALRMAVQQLNLDANDTDYILVTTCDADSKFPPQYIAALTHKYLKENRPALNTIYQAPLFYNWKLDGLSFVTRVTGLLRSFLMLGALIPFNINTMSIFSYSLSLAIKGNYIHPAYQMDDIICLIRWMGVTQQRLKISMVPVPVLSGPTSGQTIELEIAEWARQARRWTIGAAEVFHYFIIKAKRIPSVARYSWGITFVIYYVILLCTAGLYGLTSVISIVLIMKDLPLIINYVMYAFLAVQMLTFLIAFVIDVFIPKLLQVEEHISIIRNIFHFITTPFVLLAYSFVELHALHEIAIYGKKVCGHDPSHKENLK